MEEKNKTKTQIIIKLASSLFVFLWFIFLNAAQASAASFYFSPKSGSYQVGKSFSVGIYVSTPESANAFQGTVNFPEDKLQLVSVSKSGSIMSLWVQEPSFSNANGTAQFEGIVLNPGYTGSDGKILSLNFKVKSAGAAEVFFGSGSILANDGAGTDILSGLGRASFSLGGSEEPVSVPVSSGVPSAPKVISSPCAEGEWCKSNSPSFSWTIPGGTTGVSILADHNAVSDPGNRSDGVINTYGYTNVEDGVWYFHVKLRNVNGWGAVTHYKFLVDTKKPDPFAMSLLDPMSALEPKPKILFEAKDGGSGIARYEIKIDDKEAKQWEDDGRHIYQTDILEPGTHIISARVFDRAGNFASASLQVEVEGIEAPKITDYPSVISAGEVLKIKAQSYGKATVTFYIQKEGSDAVAQSVVADTDGNVLLIFEGKLSEGRYTVSAQATNEKGARSVMSNKVSIAVSQRAFMRIGTLLISYLSVVISLLSLILMLVILIVYIWKKLYTLKMGVKKEVDAVEQSVHVAFDQLREGARKHITSLEKVRLKRELTKEEAKILIQLKNQLTSAERFINKEVQQIEKRLK